MGDKGKSDKNTPGMVKAKRRKDRLRRRRVKLSDSEKFRKFAEVLKIRKDSSSIFYSSTSGERISGYMGHSLL